MASIDEALQILTNVTNEDLERLSSPSLIAFHTITKRWGLSTQEQTELLGVPSTSKYINWLRRRQDSKRLVLAPDILMRISAVLSVHRSLIELFPDEEEPLVWLKEAHQAEIFGGRAPLTMLLEDGSTGPEAVARYLHTWRFS